MCRSHTLAGLAVVLTVGGLAGCGDDTGGGEAAVEVPEGATFCSVFTGEYAEALAAVIPTGEEGDVASVEEVAAWARVLADLAPEEISDEAQANVDYFEAQADRQSVADHVDASNDLAAYGFQTC